MGTHRGTRYSQMARDLRNEAAHNVYGKSPHGVGWRMQVGRRQPVALDEFARGYRQELEELKVLLVRAGDMARVAE